MDDLGKVSEATKRQSAQSLFWMAKGAWLWELGRRRVGLDYIARRLDRPESEIARLVNTATTWTLDEISDLYAAIGAEPVVQATLSSGESKSDAPAGVSTTSWLDRVRKFFGARLSEADQ